MKPSNLLLAVLFCTLVVAASAQEQTADGGAVIAGTTFSYTTDATGTWADMIATKVDGSGNVDWFDHYGGVFWDTAMAIRQTTDGGTVMMGGSDSFTYPDFSCNLYKLDAGGAVTWRRTYTLLDYTWGVDVRQTADGGYIVVGGTSPSYTYGDFFALKVDAAGNKQWQKTYGGSMDEWATTVLLTEDGGYMLGGSSTSYVHGSVGPFMASDFLLYKLDAAGHKQWRKNFGGGYPDYGVALAQTVDGGYIFSGQTHSYVHGDNSGWPFMPTDSDFLVYKLDAAGNKQWRKNYGGMLPEYEGRIVPTADGGYLLSGCTYSFVTGDNSGWPFMPIDEDLLIYKLDAEGNKQWRRHYGGMLPEYGGIVFPSSDGGFFLYGTTSSYVHGDNSSWPYGPSDSDLLLYRLDADGNKLWRRNYGGTEPEWCLGN